MEQRIGDLVEIADAGINAVVHIDRGAAALLAPGIIADQAYRELVVRLEQQLPAREEAVSVVDRRVVGRIVVKTVALDPNGVETRGDRVGERPRHATRQPAQVVIADRRLAIDLRRKARFFGDDVDQARRGIAAKQRTLRTAQHFDPVDLAKFVEADARTRPVDAIDKHGNRALQARVVADSADAADASGAIGFRARGRNEQRRGQLVQLADVGCTAVLHLVAANGGHRNWNVLKNLAASLRRDDDLVVVLRLGGCLRLRSHSRLLRRRWLRGLVRRRVARRSFVRAFRAARAAADRDIRPRRSRSFRAGPPG